MVELSRPVLDIGLVVSNLNAALSFYRDKLGLKTPSATISEPEQPTEDEAFGPGPPSRTP